MWDDDADVSPTITSNEQFSNHSSKSFNGGFSVGKGRGFGNFRDMNNALPQVGSNNYSNQNNKKDDLWDDAPKQSSGSQNDVGSSWQPEPDNKSSWGRDSSDRRNNNTTSSWSNKREDTNTWEKKTDVWGSSADDRRSGFKSSRDKGSGCFNCGQEGHMSRECPSGEKRGKACFKCGEEGHTSRDCPNNNNASSERRSRGCFNCGEDGHMSRDCPTKNSEDNRRSKGCFKCGDEGHMSRDCTNPSSDSNRKGKGCFKCGDEGHMSRDCTNPSSDGSRKGKGCFNCGEEGHMSRDCTNPTSDSNRKGKGCFNCGEEGHMSKECPNPDKRLGPDGKPRPAPYIPPDPSENEDELFEGVPTGINFSKYDTIPVDVTGTLVPPAIQHFTQASFLPTITKNIQKSGYDKPTPVQKYAIPIIMKKRDLMACAQTGSGKTAAFLLPIIQEICSDPNLASNSGHDVQTPLAVVVAPTRELAIQIFHEAQKFSHDSIVRSEVVYGGTSVGHQSSRIKRGCHILVATPGRLLDFVEKGKVSFEKLRYLVLDEADRMLDMGFIPAIRKMVEDPNMPQKGQKQTLMFSATFPAEIQNLAKDFLDDYIYLTVGMVGAANTDVEQTLFKLDRYDKRQKLMDILSEAGTDRTLVFVEQKRTADFIASFTSQNGIPTTSIHGDRLQKEREEALRDFRTGRMPVLVATAVAARGLDIRDVRHVINYDLPQAIDEYVHRIGRTGRVGNIGKATSFYDSNVDQPLARSLKKILVDAQQEIPDWLSEEANNAVGTEPQYSGRGNFGSRDVRNQGRSNRGGGRSDAWNNDFSSSQNDNFVTNSDMSQPLCPDDSWD